jgi:hypothetical protein
MVAAFGGLLAVVRSATTVVTVAGILVQMVDSAWNGEGVQGDVPCTIIRRYLNWKFTICREPSFNVSCNTRHVPTQEDCVFQL